MKRLLAGFLAIIFVLWIMPLGCFIKPSQEKLACDGQRAMCMCHVMIHHSLDRVIESGIVLKAAASANKENPSAGNYFVSAKPVVLVNLLSVNIFQNPYLCYKNPFLAALEYVPKI